MNFQDVIFSCTFFIMSLRGVVFLPSTCIGQPRYVPTSIAYQTPKGFLISLINLLGVFGLKITCHLP